MNDIIIKTDCIIDEESAFLAFDDIVNAIVRNEKGTYNYFLDLFYKDGTEKTYRLFWDYGDDDIITEYPFTIIEKSLCDQWLRIRKNPEKEERFIFYNKTKENFYQIIVDLEEKYIIVSKIKWNFPKKIYDKYIPDINMKRPYHILPHPYFINELLNYDIKSSDYPFILALRLNDDTYIYIDNEWLGIRISKKLEM